MAIENESPILTELRLLSPDGFEREQIICYPPSQWKHVTQSSMVEDLVKYHHAWDGVEFVRVGGTQYGDEVVITSADPVSSEGAIYAMGEMDGPKNNEHWPEGVIRLGLSAKEWVDRVTDFGDDYCVCPGSLDEDLGDRADEYRARLRALNPGLDW